MLLREVLLLLDCSTVSILHKNRDADFLFISEIENAAQATAPDTLYFAIASSLNKGAMPDNRAPCSLVVYEDTAVSDAIKSRFSNIILVSTQENYREIHQMLQTNLEQSLRFNSQLQEFMELIAVEDDLSKIAQWLSYFFEHPINIVDNNFTYLGHSDIAGFADFGSDELMKDVTNGFVAPDHIQYIQQTQGINLFRDSSFSPSLVFSPGQGFHQYHTPIPIGDTIAGAYSVYLPLDELLSPLACLYLPKIAKLISMVLQRKDFYASNKSDFYTTFFSAMLDGYPDRAKHWEIRLRAYGFNLQPCLHIVAAKFPERIQKRSELQNMSSALRHIIPNSIYCIRENMILLLCCSQAGTFSIDTILQDGSDFFARSGVKLGISSEFSSIYDMAAYSREARAAITLGARFMPTSTLYCYDDFRLQDIICSLPPTTNIDMFCYPPFMELFQHDKKNGTQLCRTVYLYLTNIKNPSNVCKRLNIHKNTLYFRLDKARAIMKGDFTPLPIATQIFMTVNILRYTQAIMPQANGISDFLINKAECGYQYQGSNSLS